MEKRLSKAIDCDDNYYGIRKVKRTVKNIELTLSSIAQDASCMRLVGVVCN